MRFKVIENDTAILFETELNEFVSREDIQVIDIKYSTSGIAPDIEQGWCAVNMHNALVRYLVL